MSNLISVSSVFSYIGYIAIAIIVLLFMVLIHELGHYTAGKLLKFKINEFSVGFGPKILQKKKKNGELLSLRAFPLGGYCAFEGEDEDGVENPAAFNNQKPWKRIIVLLAGALFNFLSGIIFSFILLLSHGYDLVQVNNITPESINYEYIKQGDVILGIENNKIDFVKDKYFNTLISNKVTKDYATYSGSLEELEQENFYVIDNKAYYFVECPLLYNVKRDGKKIDVNGKINVVYNSKGELEGWSLLTSNNAESREFSITTYKYSFLESLSQAVPFAFKWAWKVLVVFFQLITGQLSIKAVGGPVTTINMIASSTSQVGFEYILILMPALAVNLAVFNLLPIPALDGFQAIFVAIEGIRKKPIKRKIINTINNIGLLVLLGFVIIVDILQFVL